jgi:hypothetical protein
VRWRRRLGGGVRPAAPTLPLGPVPVPVPALAPAPAPAPVAVCARGPPVRCKCMPPGRRVAAPGPPLDVLFLPSVLCNEEPERGLPRGGNEDDGFLSPDVAYQLSLLKLSGR